MELEDRLMNFRDVEYKGFVKTESEIIELFYFKFQDYPLLSACTLIITIMVLLANLLVELLYAVIDPRVKASQQD